MIRIVQRGHRYSIDLIEALVSEVNAQPVSLIVCSTKNDFAQQILAGANQQLGTGTRETTGHHQHDLDGDLQVQHEDVAEIHPLLLSKLSILAASRKITLFFGSTIPTFRAHLADFACMPHPQDAVSKQSRGARRLVILNLLNLHHGTSEYTLQGLSASFAAAVASAHQARSHLILVECNNILDPENPAYGDNLWNASVPLLSGSIRLAGGGAEWANRTISTTQVANRWFGFEDDAKRHGETSQEKNSLDQEEMLI